MKKRIEFIDFEEFKDLYKKCNNKELKLVIALGFGSGLRISEILGYKRQKRQKKNKQTGKIEFIKDDSEIPPLTPDKFDLKKHQITLDDTKGKKWRIVPCSPLIKPEHLKMLPLKVKRRTLQYQFKAHAKKILNKNISIHILRHGFGNYLINVKKIPITMVQGMMGHSSVSVTGVYAKANPTESINEAWKAMGGE